jgi:hypothetical protein
MPTYTLERGGKSATVESPRDLSPQELTTLSTQHFGAAEKPKPSPEDSKRAEVKRMLDHKARGGFLTNPEGWTEHAANLMVTAPLIGLGGKALGAAMPSIANVAQFLGRAGTAGGIGAGQAASQGGNVTEAFLVDALVAGLTEGVITKVGTGFKVPIVGKVKGLTERGAPARAAEAAEKAPAETLATIAQRLPKAKFFNVPSLSNQPMTVSDAVAKLAKMKDDPLYAQVRGEIINEMNRLDIQKMIALSTGAFVKGPGPSAGSLFERGTSPSLFTPPAGSRIAESIRPHVLGPQVRAAADALTTMPTEEGIPLGGLAGVVGLEYAKAGGHSLKGAVTR